MTETVFGIFNSDDGSRIISGDMVSWIHSNQIIEEAYTNPSLDLSFMHYQRVLCISIKIDSIEVAELAVFEANILFRDFDFGLIDKIGLLISAQLQKNILLNLDYNQIPNYILADLIEGKAVGHSILSDRKRYLRWARTDSLYIMVICDKGNKPFESIKSAAFQTLKTYIPIEQCIIYDSRIVAFFDQILYDILFNKHSGSFLPFLKKNNLLAGVSQRYSLLTESRRQYKNAITALEIGMARKINCSFFNDCTLDILTNLVLSQYDLIDFCHPAVIMLLKYDKEHGTEYLDTLKQYIYYTSAPAEAAQVLNIHKNTLFYRIGKIKEMTGITLDFGDKICKIFFSIKMLEVESLTSNLDI